MTEFSHPSRTKAALQAFVVKQREHGLRPVTVNTYIGALNAFCAWLHAEGRVAERVKLSKLRVEKRILPVLDDAHMRALIGFKPTSVGPRRVTLPLSWHSTLAFVVPRCFICGLSTWTLIT